MSCEPINDRAMISESNYIWFRTPLSLQDLVVELRANKWLSDRTVDQEWIALIHRGIALKAICTPKEFGHQSDTHFLSLLENQFPKMMKQNLLRLIGNFAIEPIHVGNCTIVPNVVPYKVI